MWLRILIVTLLSTIIGCVTIPAEAAQLSSILGQMLFKAKSAHISIVEQHFDNLALQVDKFAMGEYKQAYIDNVRKLMRQKDPSFTDLTPPQYDAAMNRIMTARIGWLKTVWANKQLVSKSLEEYYALMEQVNAEVTNLIKSAAGIENARNKLINDFTSQFGVQSKDLENKLMGSVTDVNNVLNGALQKLLGE